MIHLKLILIFQINPKPNQNLNEFKVTKVYNVSSQERRELKKIKTIKDHCGIFTKV